MLTDFDAGMRFHTDLLAEHAHTHHFSHCAQQDSAHVPVQISPSPAVNRRSASWPGMTAEIVQANRRGRIDYHCCASVHMLVVYERGVRDDGCTVIEGLPDSALRDCRRKLVFVPAGYKYHDWHVPRTLSRVLFFYLDPAQLAAASQLDPINLPLTPRHFFEDSALMETALKLATVIEKGGSEHRSYGEALGVVLLHELLRINARSRDTQGRINGGLAAWQRRKAIAYIEEHLAEPLSLAALAQLAGLSSCYFCRAFRQSFGMPPQRYQMHQRIEHAKSLLGKHTATVTDVGYAVGYSDTSSFSTAFRRVSGLTPTAYRRCLD
jgi:AraC family transcriptional regulator